MIGLTVDIEEDHIHIGGDGALDVSKEHDVLQFRQDTYEAAHVARDGRWRFRSAVGSFGHCGAVGSGRAKGRETRNL
jgi:hypothetical protein